MKTSILLIFILLIFSSAKALAETTPLMQNVKSCYRGPFETYDKWQNFLASKKKHFNIKRFEKFFPRTWFNTVKAALECKDFTYQVDGYTVEGFYLKPRHPSTKKLPVVIYNRGGNADFGYVVFGKKLQLMSDIAMAGYLVIGSQYRGSSAKFILNNGQDEFGGADINDVLTLLKVAKEIPEADSSNFGMVGWSRGAMQSYIASKSMPSLKTLVAIAGNSDVEKALIWRPKMEKVYKTRVPNFADNRAAELESRSVSKWLDKIPPTMPILLLHGDKDKRVNVEQSKSLALQLENNNHPHKLIIYPNDGHALFKHQNAMTKAITAWLNLYLKPS